MESKEYYIMSRLTNGIKKYAMKNISIPLNQSIFMDMMLQSQFKQTVIQEDEEIKLRETQTRQFAQINPSLKSRVKIQKKIPVTVRVDHHIKESSLASCVEESPEREVSEDVRVKNSYQRSSKKFKSKYRNFIQIQNLSRLESQKNIGLQHKIQKLRSIKLQASNKDNMRLQKYPYKERNKNKMSLHIYNSKKNESNFRRERQNGNGYVPIGYEGQILQKKMGKQSDLVKYNTHFIDMEIQVDPNSICMGSDGKQNSSKKEEQDENIFDRIRIKKIDQIFNSKNVCNPDFKVNTSIQNNHNQLKFQKTQKKLSNFTSKNEKSKVRLTLRQLMQFKQIIYRRKEQEYFRVQQSGSHHQTPRELRQNVKNRSNNNLSMNSSNLVKKKEVIIQNFKDYEQLVRSLWENEGNQIQTSRYVCSKQRSEKKYERHTAKDSIKKQRNIYLGDDSDKPMIRKNKFMQGEKKWRLSCR